ncbi:MAG: MFS transporter [Gammaproteobacteria bacterium]|nr:MFS transporter [Gammaproteobacteria bacterium]
MTSLEIRSAAAVGLLYVVRMLGLFMVLPVLPLVAEDLDGATPLLIGLALGIYGLSQACLQIPLGLLSDRIGRKKVIFGGLVVSPPGQSGGGNGGLDSRHCTGPLPAGVWRDREHAARAGVGRHAGRTPRQSHGDRRDRYRCLVSTALILGPFIASFGGLSAVFLFCAAGAVLGMLVLIGLIPEPMVRSQNPDVAVDPARIIETLSGSGPCPDHARRVRAALLAHEQLRRVADPYAVDWPDRR